MFYLVFKMVGQGIAADPLQVDPQRPWEMGGSPRYETRGVPFPKFDLITAVEADTAQAAVQEVASMTQTLGSYVAVEASPVGIELTASARKAISRKGEEDHDALQRRIKELEGELGIAQDVEAVE